jgi:hypothetical protein
LGADGFWGPYFAILPRTFDTPLYFEDEDLTYLEGANLSREVVEARRGEWEKEWRAGMAAGGVEGVTWELFLWAASALSSRCFPGALIGGKEEPVLFPLLDAMNHRPRSRITWQPREEEELGFVTVDTVECGEVWNNYGPKGNEELLLGYGFALRENPADTVKLKLGKEVHYLTMEDTPEKLLEVFKNAVAAPSGVPGKRDQIAAQWNLVMALQRKLMAFPPVGEPRNEKQKAAMILREGQMQILNAAVGRAEREIRRLWEQGGLFTIETVMAEETFAEAIEECFETRDVEELVEAEQEDVVFVLWLCWKFVMGDEGWRRWFERMEKVYEREDEAEEGVQEVFDAVFPEAAEVAPDVFGDEQWNAALMGWVMEVYQGEGVNVEVDGRLLYVVSNEVRE